MVSSYGTKRVVIVGGGLAGSVLAKSLQDVAEVYLIDPKEYFEVAWASLRCMVEPSFAEKTLINHNEYAPNAHIITSPAISISETEVTTANGRVISYDYIVIATGHDDKSAFTKNEQIGHYKANQEKIKSSNSILIVGGGPVGVELAGEISVDFPDKKVSLVHRGPRLLEFVGEKASKKALKWLNKKNVEVVLGESVTNLDSNTNGGVYRTTGGKSIKADCHFLCIGKPVASSWLKETMLRGSLDNKGRLMVDEYMRVKGHRNIFAVGDITDVKEMKQGYLAQMHSGVVAKSIKSLVNGKEKLEAYKGGPQMAIVSLGRREAVAQISSMTMSGCLPGKMKSGDLFVTKTRKSLGVSSK
ncbi:oxidoreductase [Lithospermum erythrorhizon]|uniref:Oxidoreductase n=1 Tax=Lithospermum erythrorhizon TaxID=34254 RepID=A0AAV3R3A4_LITER